MIDGLGIRANTGVRPYEITPPFNTNFSNGSVVHAVHQVHPVHTLLPMTIEKKGAKQKKSLCPLWLKGFFMI